MFNGGGVTGGKEALSLQMETANTVSKTSAFQPTINIGSAGASGGFLSLVSSTDPTNEFLQRNEQSQKDDIGIAFAMPGGTATMNKSSDENEFADNASPFSDLKNMDPALIIGFAVVGGIGLYFLNKKKGRK
jgi:hypothetical protein